VGQGGGSALPEAAADPDRQEAQMHPFTTAALAVARTEQFLSEAERSRLAELVRRATRRGNR
jgi:hypothetical protein